MTSFNHTEIRIETLPPMIVASCRTISATPETDSTLTLRNWLATTNLQAASIRTFGFDVEVPTADSQAGKRGYETWVTVPNGTQPSAGISMKAFPGGLYAAMTLLKPFDDPFETIPNGWKYLHEWVINSAQYQGGHHQWLEELLVHEDGDDLKLYHPVTAKIMPA